MKTILVPCDFSETSNNAVHYATCLANDYSLNIILFHAVQIPSNLPELVISTYTVAEIKSDAIETLQKLKLEVKKTVHASCTVECLVEVGEPEGLIIDLAQAKKVTLIVMGISGHGNSFIKFFVGSTATAVSQHTQTPVLIVPPKYHYKKITTLAFANDYNEDTIDDLTLLKVAEFTQWLNAKLNLLHVVSKNHFLTNLQLSVNEYVEHEFENTKHSSYIINEDKVSVGLLNFISHHNVDVIITEPKKHSILYSIFHPSTSHELAFFSPIPVLNIHQ